MLERMVVTEDSRRLSDTVQLGCEISVIVVTYNSAGVLPEMLEAVSSVLPFAEVIVVDNGSSDETPAIVEDSSTDVILVGGHGNVGFGAGVNIGARAASRDLLAILNPDAPPVSMDQGALQLLLRKDRVGLCACRVRLGSGKYVHLLHRQWGWRREVCWSLGRSMIKPREMRVARPRVRRGRRADWAVGAALLVNRREFAEVGGFDERFFLYGEDRDLAARYLSHNLPVESTDAITVTHSGGASSPPDAIKQTIWGQLALIQHTANWNGQKAAVGAVRLSLSILGLLEGLPRVGRLRRVTDKARAVRGGLLGAALDGADSTYPAARLAITDAQRRG